MAHSQFCFNLTVDCCQQPTMVLMRVKASLWRKALPPPDLILFPFGKILYFLSRLSLLSEATKERQAIFTKHGKHEVLGVRRLVPVGVEFTCTITWLLFFFFFAVGQGCPELDPPHWLLFQSKHTVGQRDKKRRNIIHIGTPAPVSPPLAVRD